MTSSTRSGSTTTTSGGGTASDGRRTDPQPAPTPPPARREPTLSSPHTLSVLVENQPGVLSRVSGLFSRRGFNIESLAVGPTEREDRSRITIRVDCTQTSIDQGIKPLNKP